jgi:CubicO group peptidase (beta-lactamase class C family)
MRPILVLFALALAIAPAQTPTGAGLDPERLKLIRPRLQELVDDQTIPGAVALVARHGKTATLEAVGWSDVEGKKPMAADSIFQIMSMTKNFTGVAIMMLVEEGRIELRRPVSDYLPEFKEQLVEERLPNGNTSTHPPAQRPTVWQLMVHTSGLAGDPDGELQDNPRTLRVPLADAVRYYGSRQRLQFEPGTRWRYSNMGIAALGRIIEVVSGEEYSHFIETRILNPLGMKDTFFFPPEAKKGRIALVYKHVGGKLTRSGAEILAGDPAKYRAGAKYPAPEFGLYSTAPDLLNFYQMLLAGGTYKDRRYLSRQSIETMTRVFTPDVNPSGWLGGTGYGLTFEVVDKPEGTLLLHSPGSYGHGGAFGTEGWMDPKNDLIRIAMVQLSDSTGGRVRSVVMQIGEAAVEK